jgi:Crp-like helix-turn-helix domain
MSALPQQADIARRHWYVRFVPLADNLIRSPAGYAIPLKAKIEDVEVLQTRDRIDSDRIPLTQEFLSQMLGVRRTTVTVVAGVLQKAGLIAYRRGHVEIINRIGLEQAACECYGIIRQRTDQALPKADV